MRVKWLAIAVVCAGVGGCGPGDGGKDMAGADMAGVDDLSVGDMGPVDMSSDDLMKDVTWTQFAQDYANTVCAHYMACGQLDAAQMAACVEHQMIKRAWDEDTEIAKGRITLNELQCLDAIKNSRCDGEDYGFWSLAKCTTLLEVPHQLNGATCLANAECVSHYCKRPGSDAATGPQPEGCTGTCAPLTPAGSACVTDEECGPNANCDATTKKCVAWTGVGTNCSDPTSPGCQVELVCATFPLAGPNLCAAPAMQMNAGGTCDPQQVMTATPPCAPGLFCQFDNEDAPTTATCQAHIKKTMACPLNVNNYISYYFLNSPCEDGTICYSTTGTVSANGDIAGATCQPFGGNGDPCFSFVPSTTFNTCKQGFYCDATGANAVGHCKPWVADGSACSSGGQCVSGAGCIADNADAGTFTTCQPAKGFKEVCDPGFEDPLCALATPAGNYCAPTGSGSGVCAPKCQ
jgi:hypothetical protein